MNKPAPKIKPPSFPSAIDGHEHVCQPCWLTSDLKPLVFGYPISAALALYIYNHLKMQIAIVIEASKFMNVDVDINCSIVK